MTKSEKIADLIEKKTKIINSIEEVKTGYSFFMIDGKMEKIPICCTPAELRVMRNQIEYLDTLQAMLEGDKGVMI